MNLTFFPAAWGLKEEKYREGIAIFILLFLIFLGIIYKIVETARAELKMVQNCKIS